MPETAETMMRSRYTAYVIGDVDYLIATRHPDFRYLSEADDIRGWIKDVTSWDKLEILVTDKGRSSDAFGFVGFQVFFHQNGHAESMFEYSRFRKHDGRWFYECGELR